MMMMTSKEIFNKVKDHLLTQGVKAEDKRGNCVFRTEGHLKCAVGCLIPDEIYQSVMENTCGTANSLVVEYPELKWMTPHLDLLSFLQAIHDTYSPQDWEKQLDKLESTFKWGDKIG